MNTITVQETDESTRRRRASKACLNCRKRKTRCNFDSDSAACRRCVEEHLMCEVPAIEKRGGYGNVLAGKEKREKEHEKRAQAQQLQTDTPASARDMSPVFSPAPDDSMLGNEMYNPNDAIEILHRAAGRKRVYAGDADAEALEESDARPVTKRKVDRLEPKPDKADGTYDFAAPSTRRLPIHDAAIVADGVLSVEEVCRLVGFFFAEIAPFYASYIPSEYQELARIAAEPALLAVICTIGARCLDDSQFTDVHKRLWKYSQSTLAALLWECPMHQVRSVIFAVLTLAEWFPGALLLSTGPGEALQRHTRICWPLMGQAIRLAGYVGLLRHDIQATIALHFTDHLLACRLGQQPMLHQTDGTEEEFPEYLVRQCTLADRARLDIVKLLHLANRSLYRSRSETHRLLQSGQYITILNLLHQLVRKWKVDYSQIVAGTSWVDRTTMFEFCHFELYVFSIALIPWQRSSSVTQLLGFDESQKFLQIAVDAATFIINHESDSNRPVKLRYSPIQWITRLLHAAVFLAKILLVGTPCTNRQDIVEILMRAASTMAKLPPDDQHIYSRPLEKICRRYAQVSTKPKPRPAKDAKHDKPDTPAKNRTASTSQAMRPRNLGTASATSPAISPPMGQTDTGQLVRTASQLGMGDLSDTHTASISPLTDDGYGEDNIWEFLLDKDILGHLANDSTPEADFFAL